MFDDAKAWAATNAKKAAWEALKGSAKAGGMAGSLAGSGISKLAVMKFNHDHPELSGNLSKASDWFSAHNPFGEEQELEELAAGDRIRAWIAAHPKAQAEVAKAKAWVAAHPKAEAEAEKIKAWIAAHKHEELEMLI